MRSVWEIIQPERFLAETYDETLSSNAEINRLDYFVIGLAIGADNHSAGKFLTETYQETLSSSAEVIL